MELYHMMAAFFPVALLETAFLFIIIRALAADGLGKRLEPAILPLLYIGVIGGIVAYVLGVMSWPLSTMTSSPLGRNHLLQATWTITYWIMLTAIVQRVGPSIWEGTGRWIMVVLGAVGATFLTLAGTLGGTIANYPSGITRLVGRLGWDVYTSFYVPTLVLVLMIAAAVALVGLGVWGMKRNA